MLSRGACQCPFRKWRQVGQRSLRRNQLNLWTFPPLLLRRGQMSASMVEFRTERFGLAEAGKALLKAGKMRLRAARCPSSGRQDACQPCGSEQGKRALVAQGIEHLPPEQGAVGSNPIEGASRAADLQREPAAPLRFPLNSPKSCENAR